MNRITVTQITKSRDNVEVELQPANGFSSRWGTWLFSVRRICVYHFACVSWIFAAFLVMNTPGTGRKAKHEIVGIFRHIILISFDFTLWARAESLVLQGNVLPNDYLLFLKNWTATDVAHVFLRRKRYPSYRFPVRQMSISRVTLRGAFQHRGKSLRSSHGNHTQRSVNAAIRKLWKNGRRIGNVDAVLRAMEFVSGTENDKRIEIRNFIKNVRACESWWCPLCNVNKLLEQYV